MKHAVHITLPADVYAAITARAEADGASISATASALLTERCAPPRYTVTADGTELGTYDRREDAERAAQYAAERFARFVIVQPTK